RAAGRDTAWAWSSSSRSTRTTTGLGSRATGGSDWGGNWGSERRGAGLPPEPVSPTHPLPERRDLGGVVACVPGVESHQGIDGPARPLRVHVGAGETLRVQCPQQV